MKCRDIGSRLIADIPSRPLKVNRLLGEQKIFSTSLQANIPLKILVEIDSTTSTTVASARIRNIWESPGLRNPQNRIASQVRVRPLGQATKKKTRWMAVELPIALGGLLEETNYSLTPIRDLASELLSLDGIKNAELDLPTENLVRPLQETIPGCTAGRNMAPTETDWAPRLTGFFDLEQPRPTGAGIRIGQIDTGFTRHEELDVEESFDVKSSTSTIDAFAGVDPMPGGSSHGTATATVITSRSGSKATTDRGQLSDGVTGLAAGATIVAVRSLSNVALVEIPFFLQSAVADAIYHCIAQNCHVLVMSFGGVVSQAVKDAITAAYDADIILCAAAGNCVGFVVEPAALPEVIACGGVGFDRKTRKVHPWPGSSAGPEIAISAPSENVWIGDWIDGKQIIRPGEGTSYAAPHVAAAAALWLEFHGRQALIDKYKASSYRLSDVFRKVLTQSAKVPPGWNTLKNGPGVLNLVSMLSSPLPDSHAVVIPPKAESKMELVPMLAEPVKTIVEITHLTVRDDGEMFGSAEPYLLLNFFTIDGDSAQIEARYKILDFNNEESALQVNVVPVAKRKSFVSVNTKGRQGSVDQVNIGPLELNSDGPRKVDIRKTVGLFRRTVKPIPIQLILDSGSFLIGLDITGLPGFVGVHALLFEEDGTPEKAIAAAQDAIAEGVKEILEDVLSTLDLSDLSVDPASFVERQADIEDRAQKAASQKMSKWELFWGGVVDPDDQLVQSLTIANVLQLENPVGIEQRYQGPHGDWILGGKIRREI